VAYRRPTGDSTLSAIVSRREIETKSAEQTVSLGRQIGEALKPPVLILLTGELGAGKTTLTKGIVSGAGAAHEEEVTSPTFTLIHKYTSEAGSGHGVVIYHIDLYRIEDRQGLESLGLEDIFNEEATVVVEWPDRLSLPTNWPVVSIKLEHISEEVRRIVIDGG
jgi:tRNA threonylcarbamoyladenosine biosynthesis protein TsaE